MNTATFLARLEVLLTGKVRTENVRVRKEFLMCCVGTQDRHGVDSTLVAVAMEVAAYVARLSRLVSLIGDLPHNHIDDVQQLVRDSANIQFQDPNPDYCTVSALFDWFEQFVVGKVSKFALVARIDNLAKAVHEVPLELAKLERERTGKVLSADVPILERLDRLAKLQGLVFTPSQTIPERLALLQTKEDENDQHENWPRSLSDRIALLCEAVDVPFQEFEPTFKLIQEQLGCQELSFDLPVFERVRTLEDKVNQLRRCMFGLHRHLLGDEKTRELRTRSLRPGLRELYRACVVDADPIDLSLFEVYKIVFPIIRGKAALDLPEDF